MTTNTAQLSFCACLSSLRMTWNTPREIVDVVRRIGGGHIALDPCSNPTSIVGARVELSIENGDDGLAADWSALADGGLIYVNPPYGRAIGEWMAKCSQEGHTARVVALVPARTDAAWWHDYATTADAICFLRGRLRFVGAQSSAPFPSALLFWEPHAMDAGFTREASRLGWVL